MRLRPVLLLGMGATALGAGCGSDKLEGRIYLSAIETGDGTAVGLAIDFISTAGTFSPEKVQIAFDVQGDELIVSSRATSSECVELPAQRLNLLAADGKLDATSRVRVQAFRVDDVTGAAGSGGSAVEGEPGSATCGGTLLDDAVWPTRGAQVGPRTGTAGTSSGGSGGGDAGGAGAGGEAGGGAAAGAGGGAGGPGEGGSAGQGGSGVGGKPTDGGRTGDAGNSSAGQGG